MAMTKEERNARKSDLRFQTQYVRYCNFKSAYLEIWIKAKAEGWTHKRMLEARNMRVLGSDAYKKSPLFIHYKLEGIWDACQQLAYLTGDLIGCYPHPDTGEYRPWKELCDQGGMVHRLDTTKFEYMWNRGDDKYVDKF